MKQTYLIVVLLLLIQGISSVSVPLWTYNPNIDAAQIAPAKMWNNAASALINNPSYLQIFNKNNFAVPPKVVISLVGLFLSQQYAPSIGLIPSLSNITQTSFSLSLSLSGQYYSDIRYSYFAAQFEQQSIYLGMMKIPLTPSNNITNTSSSSRQDVFTPSFPSSNALEQITDIKVFLNGFITRIEITGGLNNRTNFLLIAKTQNGNSIRNLSISIVGLNSQKTIGNYSFYIDTNTLSSSGSNLYGYQSFILPSKMITNNFITGISNLNLASTYSPIQFHYYKSSNSPGNITWNSINSRMRSCKPNSPYYQPHQQLCYQICPAYYHTNINDQICRTCDYSCLNCTQPNQPNRCNACSNQDYRVLNGTICLCKLGYFQKYTRKCGIVSSNCNNQCLTCDLANTNYCLSCNAGLYRSLNSHTNSCNCIQGYYDNNTCLKCSSYNYGCSKCKINTYIQFQCIQCNGANRTINSYSLCTCIKGMYEQNNICYSCSSTCLTCQSQQKCLTCIPGRYLGRLSSCVCNEGTYQAQNKSCIICPKPCSTCSLQSGVVVCNSCNILSNRQLVSSQCTCLKGYYDNGVETCSQCDYRCLTCTGISSNCTACSANRYRQLVSQTKKCICMNGYYESGECYSCSVSITGCSLCQNNGRSIMCTKCQDNNNRQLNADGTCKCIGGYYQNAGICSKCPINCTSCSMNYLQNRMQCNSCNSALNRTLTASQSCQCRNDQYEQSATKICRACPLNCTSCYEISQGAACRGCIANNYISSNKQSLYRQPSLLLTCGNGNKEDYEQCDDGNLQNGDGCSSKCIIEPSCNCTDSIQQNNLKKSICTYSRPIKIDTLLIYKIPGQNTVKFEMKVSAPDCNENQLKDYLEQGKALMIYPINRQLQQSQKRQLQYLSPSYPSSITYNPQTRTLTILYRYLTDIDLTRTKIIIVSSNLNSQIYRYFTGIPVSQASLTNPHNKLSTNYYTDSQLKSVDILNITFHAIVFAYIVFLAFNIIRKRAAAGLQCILVIEVAYLTLIDQKQIGQGWSGLQSAGRYLFGFSFDQQSTSTQSDTKALQIDANLAYSINITLALLLGFIGIVSGYLLYQQIKSKNRKEQEKANEQEQAAEGLSPLKRQSIMDIAMVYLFDACFSLIVLLLSAIVIGLIFTNEANLQSNLLVLIIFLIAAITYMFLWRNYRDTLNEASFLAILIKVDKCSYNAIAKFLISNYYWVLAFFLGISSLLIALLRENGLVVYSLIMVGCIGMIIFHTKFNIFFYTLDSKRSIFNSIMLLALMALHASSAVDHQKGLSLDMASIGAGILLINLFGNVGIMMGIQKKKAYQREDDAIFKDQQKWIDSKFAKENVSNLVEPQKNYQTNNSRYYTTHKQVLQVDSSSTARQGLIQNEQKDEFSNNIEARIRELRQYKKNINLMKALDDLNMDQFKLQGEVELEDY